MPLRLLVTADLHYNHPRSAPLADDVIARMNAAGGDVLLVAGDTAVADGDPLERCLSKFDFAGPKLFVAGNHELWTKRGGSLALFEEELPRRVRALGWHWLEAEPFVAGDVAVVGTVGWYDFTFAQPSLGIPTRFYAAKVSPGAAIRLAPAFDHLQPTAADVPRHAREIVARWNDGKFVHLGRTDEQFLGERVAQLAASLEQVRSATHVVAAVHHLPFAELLPPPHSAQWDFAKAYLGSAALGAALLAAPNVTHCFCGHSHFPAAATIGHVRAVNIGSGYRWKTFHTLDLGT